jgi:cell division protein FtsB
MAVEKNVRRMTLRQLLTSAEKCSRDLAEQLQTTLLSRIADCRDLTRPVRRRSHYPTLIALVNSLTKLNQADTEIEALVDYLLQQMEAIREQARKERFHRR